MGLRSWRTTGLLAIFERTHGKPARREQRRLENQGGGGDEAGQDCASRSAHNNNRNNNNSSTHTHTHTHATGGATGGATAVEEEMEERATGNTRLPSWWSLLGLDVRCGVHVVRARFDWVGSRRGRGRGRSVAVVSALLWSTHTHSHTYSDNNRHLNGVAHAACMHVLWPCVEWIWTLRADRREHQHLVAICDDDDDHDDCDAREVRPASRLLSPAVARSTPQIRQMQSRFQGVQLMLNVCSGSSAFAYSSGKSPPP